MTTLRLRFYLKIILFTFFFFLACGFQTSFWPHVISFLPSPQIWLLLIFFITLKWPPLFTIFYIYFLGFCLTRFSQIPLKMAWTTLLITFTFLTLLRNRVQLSGVFSFVLYCLLGSLIFQISYVLLSEFLEKIPTTVLFTERFLQILMNFIFSYPFYAVFEALDRVLGGKDKWTQASSGKQEFNL
jgi:hypothetical protein